MELKWQQRRRQYRFAFAFFPATHNLMLDNSAGSWESVGGGNQWGGSWEGWSSGVTESGVSLVSKVGVLDNGLGAGDLDDVLAPDWDGMWDSVWLGHVDGGGDLDDLLDVLDDVIGDGVWLLNMDGLVDDKGLLLDLDNSWVDLLGALECGWHGDADVWDGWLQDL